MRSVLSCLGRSQRLGFGVSVELSAHSEFCNMVCSMLQSEPDYEVPYTAGQLTHDWSEASITMQYVLYVSLLAANAMCSVVWYGMVERHRRTSAFNARCPEENNCWLRNCGRARCPREGVLHAGGGVLCSLQMWPVVQSAIQWTGPFDINRGYVSEGRPDDARGAGTTCGWPRRRSEPAAACHYGPDLGFAETCIMIAVCRRI